jgi:hypothetical protein
VLSERQALVHRSSRGMRHSLCVSLLSPSNSARVEANLADLDAKMESKKMELVHLQTQLQQRNQTQAQAIGGPTGGAPRAVQTKGV